jgi:hypothetical protein
MRTIAEHHLHNLALAQAISALYDMPGLPPEEPMCDAESPGLIWKSSILLGKANIR